MGERGEVPISVENMNNAQLNDISWRVARLRGQIVSRKGSAPESLMGLAEKVSDTMADRNRQASAKLNKRLVYLLSGESIDFTGQPAWIAKYE